MDAHVILILLACLLAILLLARLIFNFRDFKYRLDYLNQEIKRSSPRGKKYWKKKRRRLWLRFLLHPF